MHVTFFPMTVIDKLGHPEEEGLEKAVQLFWMKCNVVKSWIWKLLNFHPGSHLNKISVEACLDRLPNRLIYVRQTPRRKNGGH